MDFGSNIGQRWRHVARLSLPAERIGEPSLAISKPAIEINRSRVRCAATKLLILLATYACTRRIHYPLGWGGWPDLLAA
jgi:hypothetical protein